MIWTISYESPASYPCFRMTSILHFFFLPKISFSFFEMLKWVCLITLRIFQTGFCITSFVYVMSNFTSFLRLFYVCLFLVIWWWPYLHVFINFCKVTKVVRIFSQLIPIIYEYFPSVFFNRPVQTNMFLNFSFGVRHWYWVHFIVGSKIEFTFLYGFSDPWLLNRLWFLNCGDCICL